MNGICIENPPKGLLKTKTLHTTPSERMERFSKRYILLWQLACIKYCLWKSHLNENTWKLHKSFTYEFSLSAEHSFPEFCHSDLLNTEAWLYEITKLSQSFHQQKSLGSSMNALYWSILSVCLPSFPSPPFLSTEYVQVQSDPWPLYQRSRMSR